MLCGLCVLIVAYCMMFGVSWLLLLLCSLFAVWCAWFAMRCWLRVARRALFAVCCDNRLSCDVSRALFVLGCVLCVV